MPNDNGRKIIGIQRFRDLIESIENLTEDQADVSDLQMSFEDSNVSDKPSKAPSFIAKVASNDTFLSFVFQFFGYLFARLRVFLILVSVAAEVFGGYFDNIKRFVVRHMFWGRGNLFKYAVQVVSVFLLVVLVVSRSYRSEVLLAAELSGDKVSASAGNIDLIVQNSTTKTQTPEESGPRLEPIEYIVKSGDTLSSIATANDISVETIQWANGLTSAHIIRTGETLKIPQGNGVLYTVEAGDTLDTIVKKFKDKRQDTNAQVIADANEIRPPFELTAGQELIIPDVRPLVAPTIASTTAFSGGYTSAPARISWNPGGTDPNVGRFLTSYPVDASILVTQCPSSWHPAYDFSWSGMPDLVAAADGVVYFAGCQSGACPAPGEQSGGYGFAWTVMVDHGNGYITTYAHMNAIYVTKGQAVKSGDHIGQMGRSGSATGVHVHFELLKGSLSNRVNAVDYFSSGIADVIGRSCGY